MPAPAEGAAARGDALCFSDVRFVAAPPALCETGLLGWVTVDVNGQFDLGGIAVRRTQDGRVVLSFPEVRDRRGGRHPIMHPHDQAARDSITAPILEALRAKGILS